MTVILLLYAFALLPSPVPEPEPHAEPEPEYPTFLSPPPPPPPRASPSYDAYHHNNATCAPRRCFGSLRHIVPIDGKLCQNPVDVGFDDSNNLYVACKDSECVYTNLDGRNVCLRDRSFYHYNAHISSIFIHKNMLATCQNSQNDYAGTKTPNMFMGLTLYNLSVGLIRTDGSSYDNANESHVPYLVHVDMLHEAPNCSHVSSINNASSDPRVTNAFIHADNFNRQLIVTDFKQPHGPGSMDHSVARVERLYGIPIQRVSSIAVDLENEVAFLLDANTSRVIRVRYTSGSAYRSARHHYPVFSSIADSFEYFVREGVDWEFMGVVENATCLGVFDNMLYVGSQSGRVHVFEKNTFYHMHVYETGVQNMKNMRVVHDLMYVVSDDIRVLGLQECNLTSSYKHPLGLGESCDEDSDCASLNCNTTCARRAVAAYSSVNHLQEYITSSAYNRSFVNQHILTGGQGSYASYLNLYPIMEPGFCNNVGNASGVPDCDLIDLDSLLLGNCWGHPCLPNHLHCENNGTLVRDSASGYTCACKNEFTGDTCQLVKVTRKYAKSVIKKKYTDSGCCDGDCAVEF